MCLCQCACVRVLKKEEKKDCSQYDTIQKLLNCMVACMSHQEAFVLTVVNLYISIILIHTIILVLSHTS